MAAVPLLSWPLSLWWLSRRAAIPVRAFWIGGIRIAVFAGVVGAMAAATVFATASSGTLLSLIFGLLAAAAAYALLGATVPSYRRDLVDVVSLVRENLRRNR